MPRACIVASTARAALLTVALLGGLATHAAAGTIAGTVTNAATSNGISGVTVNVFNSVGGFVTTATTNATGAYTTGTLSAGTYFARTSNNQNLLDKLYNDLPCIGDCDVTTGTPITVTAAGTTTVDFALALAFTGTVTNATTGDGVSGVVVWLESSTGLGIYSAITNASGFYTFDTTLAPGSYFAHTESNQGINDELYNDISCEPGCTATTGTPITVTSGVATNINFSLAPGMTILGTVINAATGAGVSGVTVQAYTNAGAFVMSAITNATGAYMIPMTLPQGSYRARTVNSQGLIDELYGDISCAGTCTITDGTSITVTGGVPSTVDFALTPGGTISGTVTNASTGAGVGGVVVQVHDGTGTLLVTAPTDAAGAYTINRLLPPETYFARTGNNQGYVDELYDNIICSGNCTVTTGTPITVPAGPATTVNFALAPGGRIGGTVTNATTGAAINGVTVQVYGSTGTSITSTVTDAAGAYTTSTLPTGSYFVRTLNSQGFIDELYDNITCLNCAVTTGTPIGVTAPATTTANFALAPGGSITGTVTNSLTGASVGNVTVQLFTDAGTFVTSATTNAAGAYTIAAGLPTGSYRARTSNAVGLIDELYDDIPCPGGSCTVTAGTPIGVTALAPTTVNFGLFPGGRIFGMVTNASTGTRVGGVSVQVFTAAGTFVTSTVTNATGAYTTPALSQDFQYVARTANDQSLIDELYNDIACVPGCLPASGNKITVQANLFTPVNFALTPGGSITGLVTNASTGSGVNGVVVNVYTSTGAFVTNVFTGPTGTYSTSGLPAGLYFARTVNNQSLIDELYDNIACLNCDPAAGTPIAVTVGAATTANFALAPGGTLGGTVTNATTGAGVGGITVLLFNSSGTVVANTSTNASGAYTIATGLPAGSYFARTGNAGSYGLRDDLYDNLPCNTCSVTTGTPIAVTTGVTHTGVNFALLPNLPTVTRADFNGDGRADILWRNGSGTVTIWLMNGTGVVAGGSVGTVDNAWQIVGTGDYNGDHKADLLWRHSSGAVTIWLMNGAALLAGGPVAAVDPAWLIAGSGDYNGDGKADLLWRHMVTGAVTIWLMDGAAILSGSGAVGTVDPAWGIVASSDFNGDGRTDLLWRHSSGAITMWLMNGSAISSGVGMGVIDRTWQILGAGDYNGDGKADILWRHGSGAVAMWFMNGGTVLAGGGAGAADLGWQIFGAGDYNGNGKADILWRHSSGTVVIWLMDGSTAVGGGTVGSADGSWRIIATP